MFIKSNRRITLFSQSWVMPDSCSECMVCCVVYLNIWYIAYLSLCHILYLDVSLGISECMTYYVFEYMTYYVSECMVYCVSECILCWEQKKMQKESSFRFHQCGFLKVITFSGWIFRVVGGKLTALTKEDLVSEVQSSFSKKLKRMLTQILF